MRKERDADLMNAYREALSRQLGTYGRTNGERIYLETVRHPALRYWVSSERAYNVVIGIDRGRSIEYMKENRRKMYLALYEEVCRIRNRHKQISTLEAVEEAVSRPAPCFPLSPRVARCIITRMKNETRKKRCGK